MQQKYRKSFSIVLHSYLPESTPNLFLNGLGAASLQAITDPTATRTNVCLVNIISGYFLDLNLVEVFYATAATTRVFLRILSVGMKNLLCGVENFQFIRGCAELYGSR